MRVFPKIENLEGEHLFELVNKDVQFAKLDDEDVVRVCLLLVLDFVFMGHELRHVVSKAIVNLVDDFINGMHFHGENICVHSFISGITTVLYGVWRLSLIQSIGGIFYSENYTVNKLIPSAIEMNELWWRSSLDYFKKANRSIPVLRSATKGSSVHTRVRTEVRHEKTSKEQKQMIIDLQVRLNLVEEKLKPGPSDVDHLDKNGHLVYNDTVEISPVIHPKRGWLSTSVSIRSKEPNADWAMASPYLCDMLSRF
ncbi:hypothetical protein Tco_0324036 [Tanacetum coccineum]